MEELIKFVKKPNGETARSAKSLYEKLGLNKSHYKKWCERNLLFNEFATYGVDYCSLALGASENGKTKAEFLVIGAINSIKMWKMVLLNYLKNKWKQLKE